MNTVYVNYYDQVTESKTKAFMAACAQIIDQMKPDRIYFLFASSGGQVDAGIALYNFLRALPVKLAFHNIGAVDSIANVVFSAGEERFATAHATFLLHGVTWNLNSAFDREALGQVNSLAIQAENKIAKILSERTNLTETRCAHTLPKEMPKIANLPWIRESFIRSLIRLSPPIRSFSPSTSLEPAVRGHSGASWLFLLAAARFVGMKVFTVVTGSTGFCGLQVPRLILLSR